MGAQGPAGQADLVCLFLARVKLLCQHLKASRVPWQLQCQDVVGRLCGLLPQVTGAVMSFALLHGAGVLPWH